MLKGQQAYAIIKPITFIPWLVAQDEIFLPITEKEVPGVYPYYMVSNYGRIHNIYSITPFMSYNIDSKGYWYTPLVTITGSVNVRNHRVEMLVFNYIDGCEKLVVDHIDGNKLNPRLSNLEWVTQAINNQRAHDLRKIAEPQQLIPYYIQQDILMLNNYNSQNFSSKTNSAEINYNQKNFNDYRQNGFSCQPEHSKQIKKEHHSDDQVKQICEMLESGYTASHIANKLHIKKSYVLSIYHKQTRADISDNYDFSEYGKIPYHDKWQFTTDQVNAICQYMQDNDIELSISKKQYVKQMFAILNIDYSDSRYRTVLDIYKGRGYLSISNNYNIRHNI